MVLVVVVCVMGFYLRKLTATTIVDKRRKQVKRVSLEASEWITLITAVNHLMQQRYQQKRASNLPPLGFASKLLGPRRDFSGIFFVGN